MTHSLARKRVLLSLNNIYLGSEEQTPLSFFFADKSTPAIYKSPLSVFLSLPSQLVAQSLNLGELLTACERCWSERGKIRAASCQQHK